MFDNASRQGNIMDTQNMLMFANGFMQNIFIDFRFFRKIKNARFVNDITALWRCLQVYDEPRGRDYIIDIIKNLMFISTHEFMKNIFIDFNFLEK